MPRKTTTLDKTCFRFGAICMLLFALGSFSSCDSGSVYEENVDLSDRIWLADSAVKFSFKIDDPSTNYDVYFNIRNTISYPYQNLYVNYTLENINDKTVLTDLYNMDLFDPKTGKPNGKGLGDIFSHEFKAISDFNFPDSGVYKLNLQQFMRRDTLPEIFTVGISVKPVGEEN